MKIRSLSIFVLVLYLIAISPKLVSAQSPTQKREFVWGLTAFTGQNYTGVFSPQEKPTIYVLSDQTHILRSSYTMVYYWPIEREFKPDWTTLNEEVSGTLVIRGADGQTVNVASHLYLMKPKDNQPDVLDSILFDNEAVAEYQAYQKDREKYLASVVEYDNRFEAYMKAFAIDPNTTEPVPTPPADFNESLQPPKSGYPINLKPGSYQISLVNSNGQTISGSERTLISIEPRQESVGFTVIPENKWTIQAPSDTKPEVIYYSLNNSAIYLQPYHTLEYNQQLFTRLENPQDTTASSDQWIWVHDDPLNNVTLQVLVNGKIIDNISTQSFSVNQLPGAALGYEIVIFDPTVSSSPDFVAFRIPSISGIHKLMVRLVDGNGKEIPGSERQLVQAIPDLPFPVYFFVILPIIIRTFVEFQRKSRSKRIQKQISLIIDR